MQYLNSPTKEKELSLYAYFEVFPIVFYNKIKDVKLTDDQTVKLVDSILSDNSEIEESVIFSTVLNKLSGRESIGAFKYENKEFRHIFGDENAVFLNKTNEFKDFSSLFLKYVYITMDDSKSSLLQSYRKSFNKAKNKPKGPLAYGGLARFFLKIRSDMYGMTGHKLKEEKSNKAFKKYTDLFKTAVIKNKANINYDLVD